jgi:acyl carrier protein phosphodiesterase
MGVESIATVVSVGTGLFLVVLRVMHQISKVLAKISQIEAKCENLDDQMAKVERHMDKVETWHDQLIKLGTRVDERQRSTNDRLMRLENQPLPPPM